MLHKEEITDLESKLIEKILTDPEARRIAEAFIRNQCPSDPQAPFSSQETAQQSHRSTS